MLFLPGVMLALPFLIGSGEPAAVYIVAAMNLAVYATVVWLLLRRRARRWRQQGRSVLPLQ